MTNPKTHALMTKHVAIIGGGISGLAAAFHLQELAKETGEKIILHIIDANERLGGVIATDYLEDCIVERGPDSFLAQQKPWAMSLCHRLGLEPQLIGTNTLHRTTFIVKNGFLYPLPDGFIMLAPTKLLPFICSPLFSLTGKLRMALDLVIPARKNNDHDESLADFVRRRFGEEALNQVAQPMIGGIYTADPNTLSINSIMPRFVQLEQKWGSIIRGLLMDGRPKAKSVPDNQLSNNSNAASGARYGLFASLDKGLQSLIDALSRNLSDASICLGKKVISLRQAKSQFEHHSCKWLLTLDDASTLAVDSIILALPAHQSAKLLEPTDSELSANLNDIPYASSAVLTMIFNKQEIPLLPDGFGFVVPAKENMSIIAATFSSVKFPGRAPDTKVIVRMFLGGAMNPHIYDLSDQDLIAQAQADIGKLLGIKSQPQLFKLYRYPNAMPQYLVGHKKKIETIFQLVGKQPGLHLAGNAYHGVGIPDCVHSGEQAARGVFETLKTCKLS